MHSTFFLTRTHFCYTKLTESLGNYIKSLRGRTLLLFVIRDHYGSPLANLKATLTSDLSRIWDGILKPPELENRLLSDYFDLEFTTLPHKMLASEIFKDEVQLLRNRFVDKDDPNYLFKDVYRRRVPADGVAFYMEGIWVEYLPPLFVFRVSHKYLKFALYRNKFNRPKTWTYQPSKNYSPNFVATKFQHLYLPSPICKSRSKSGSLRMVWWLKTSVT